MKARKLTQPTGRPVHVIEPTRHARAYRPDRGVSVSDPLIAPGRTAGKEATQRWRRCRWCGEWFWVDQSHRVNCSPECSRARWRRSQRGKS